MIGSSNKPRKNDRTSTSVDAGRVPVLSKNGQGFLTHGRDICALQDTRWSGAKNGNIERERGKNGYKLLYFGSPFTQYGVGIAISKGFRDTIKEVERFDDRLMKLTIISADR